MIGIKIDGQLAELKPETRISFRLNNPIFNDNNLSPGSYTLPFQLPGPEVSAVNAGIFKNLDVIPNIDRFTKQSADILFDQVKFRSGKIKPSTASGRLIETNFVFGLTTISDEIKTKRIRDLVDEEIVISDTARIKKIYLKTEAANPFPLIVNGRTYDEDTLSDLAIAINADLEEPRASAAVELSLASPNGFVAPYLIITSLDDTDNPLAELSVDVENNYNTGVTGDYNWRVYAEIGTANAYYDDFNTAFAGYFEGPYIDNKLRFPVIINKGTGAKYFAGLHNNRAAGEFITNVPAGTEISFGSHNKNSVAPFVMLKYVLDTIADYFGFEWDGDFYNTPELAEMLIWNPNGLSVVQPFIGKDDYVFWRRSFNVRELVPDLTVVEFIKAIADRYNLAVYKQESTGKVRMVSREAIAKNAAFDDITSLCSISGNVVDMSLTGIKLMATKEADDALATDDSFDIGDPEKTYPTALSTCDGTNNHPAADDFEFRIFYGSTPQPSTDLYYDKFYDPVNTPPYSIYNVFWKRWIAYELRRKSVPVEINFEFTDLQNLDWEKKYRFDRVNYMIKSLQFEMSSRGLSVCKAELYTMQ